ncbi:MAG: biopolymer transporter ExbD [Bacteroidales bacterium]|nr:biopolymer transporter ExbD [Bacteroidales bacterium]MCF8404254.1 biopolymer transporter ExbD [Bacteroidales bacterium]
MPINTRNKRKADFNMASMSDLVFLLLIFFMLTSTLVAPNAIKLLLPQSNSRTIEKPPKIIISINGEFEYFLQGVQVDESALKKGLLEKLEGRESASIRLESDKNVPVQYVVNVIDIVNEVNNKYGTTHKVIMATSPKRTR